MKQVIALVFEVPHAGYKLTIQAVYQDDAKLIVVSRLVDTGFAPGGSANVSHSVKVSVKAVLPVVHYVMGVSQLAWFNDPQRFTAIDSEWDIPECQQKTCRKVSIIDFGRRDSFFTRDDIIVDISDEQTKVGRCHIL